RGYPFEAHYVTTDDGYIIALHRIPRPSRESRQSDMLGSVDVLDGEPRPGPELHGDEGADRRPVVLFWHGLLMCSEVWVCLPDRSLSLPMVLADAGFDVWLGNSRGNKYSCKHTTLKFTESRFWDFSIDHLVCYDVPNSVKYILSQTGAASLAYIGFSQGSAQGLAALAMSPQLNQCIHLFIGLAPVTKPPALTNRSLFSFINTSPEIIYLLFGRKSLIPSCVFWQSVMTSRYYASFIDQCVWFLFGWKSAFINHKEVAYQHLYSYTSVKCVVHWFQIMRTGRFQMYDESPEVFVRQGRTSAPISVLRGHIVPKFPTENIRTPIALFYGGQDTLADMKYVLKEAPTTVFCLRVEEYEHVHFLWGVGIEKAVFPAILGLLNDYGSSIETPSQMTDTDEIPDRVAQSSGTLRTVSWISPQQIYEAVRRGRGERRPTLHQSWTTLRNEGGVSESGSNVLVSNGVRFNGNISIREEIAQS
ncbi:Alpha/Beta hydrolase protein, partial [Polychytrium aggregatum]|uniref:Alpha/Beta hydrolase protein n=1 Tax=Polychytrium aggregatum TaxID=110093 RepID=UPI0022FE04FA